MPGNDCRSTLKQDTIFVQIANLEIVSAQWLPFIFGCNGPLARYTKLRVAHAPGMPGTFSSPLISKETPSWRYRHASRHVRHARAVMHVGIANQR